MRMTLFAIALLPAAAQAQTVLETEPAETAQSCAVGLVWDQGAQSCVAADDGTSPVQSLTSQQHNCGGAPRSIIS